MAYRYAFLLLHTANNIFLAHQSRTVGQMASGENRRWIAASVTTLLAKSYHLSQGVYLAMLARGFQGEVQILETFRLKTSDWLWGATFLTVALLAILMGT
jgi:cobalt/nickel transport system permease protein